MQFLDLPFWISGIRGLMAMLCQLIYPLISWLYTLFINVSKVNILSTDSVKPIYQRVTLILTIVMIFYVTFELVKFVVQPDGIADKEKGAGKIVTRMVIVVVLIAFVPTIFEGAMKLQTLIIDKGVIGKVIIGTKAYGDSEPDKFGPTFAASVFNLFYNVDEENREEDCDGINCGMLVQMNLYTLQNGGKMPYLTTGLNQSTDVDTPIEGETTEMPLINFEFHGLLAVAVGVFIAYILAIYCIDVGVRWAQLVFLQVIAPIPIIGYLSPQKDGIFQKWCKQCLATYLDIFLRTAIIYFILLICSVILKAKENDSLFANLNIDDTMKAFIYIILIMGLMLFAKKAPDLLSELFPSQTKASGNFGLKAGDRVAPLVARTAGAALGGTRAIGGAVARAHNRHVRNKANGQKSLLTKKGREQWAQRQKNRLKKFTSGIEEIGAQHKDNEAQKNKKALEKSKAKVLAAKNEYENAKDEQTKKAAKEKLDKAAAEHRRLVQKQNGIKASEEQMREVSEKRKKYQDARAAYGEAVASGDQKKIEAAKQAMDAARTDLHGAQSKIYKNQEQFKARQGALAAGENAYTEKKKAEYAHNILNTATQGREEAELDRQAATESRNQASAESQKAQNELSEAQASKAEAEQRKTQAQAELDAVKESKTEAEQREAQAQAALDAAKATNDAEQIAFAQGKLDAAKANTAAIEQKEAEVQGKLDAAKANTAATAQKEAEAQGKLDAAKANEAAAVQKEHEAKQKFTEAEKNEEAARATAQTQDTAKETVKEAAKTTASTYATDYNKGSERYATQTAKRAEEISQQHADAIEQVAIDKNIRYGSVLGAAISGAVAGGVTGAWYGAKATDAKDIVKSAKEGWNKDIQNIQEQEKYLDNGGATGFSGFVNRTGATIAKKAGAHTTYEATNMTAQSLGAQVKKYDETIARADASKKTHDATEDRFKNKLSESKYITDEETEISTGIFEKNADGSIKLDANKKPIPKKVKIEKGQSVAEISRNYKAQTVQAKAEAEQKAKQKEEFANQHPQVSTFNTIEEAEAAGKRAEYEQYKQLEKAAAESAANATDMEQASTQIDKNLARYLYTQMLRGKNVQDPVAQQHFEEQKEQIKIASQDSTIREALRKVLTSQDFVAFMSGKFDNYDQFDGIIGKITEIKNQQSREKQVVQDRKTRLESSAATQAQKAANDYNGSGGK